MKLTKDEMRPGIPALGDVLVAADMGEMAAAIVTVPAGTDMRPVLQQLPEGACPVPHWGYVINGVVNIGYDGRVESVKAGELFWMEPGHVVRFDEDTSYVDFSPGPEMNALLGKISKIVEG